MQATLTLAPSRFDDPEALAAAAALAPTPSRDLLDALLLLVGPGGTVPPSARGDIDAVGGALWRCGALLPRVQPSAGAVIDPRQFAMRCRLNPALTAIEVLADVGAAGPRAPSMAPSSAWWDAVVVAARVQHDPPQLTQAGAPRKDHLRRLLEGLGADTDRWTLALSVALEARLVIPDGESWMGRPEARGRRLRDPAALPGPARLQWAARLWQRLLRDEWRDVDAVATALCDRMPAALTLAGAPLPPADVAPWLQAAADRLHRLEVVDAARGPDGVVAVRRRAPQPPRPQGALVSSDLEVLLAPGELDRGDYGRLARLAPYVDGDVVYRHRLTEAGVRLDQVEGGGDPVAWLAERARFGLPASVAAVMQSWLRSAGRLVLWTGATVVEEAGQFRRLTGDPPAGARSVRNDPAAPELVRGEGDHIEVPFGHDPLRLRARLDRIAAPEPPSPTAWRWRVGPTRVADPDTALRQLEAAADGPLPASLRVAVRAGALDGGAPAVPALLLRLPRKLRAAVLDDPIAASLVDEVPRAGALVVRAGDLEALRARLGDLGLEITVSGDEPAP